MVVMAEYLTQDRLSELKRHINQLHYSYLETEETPQKIDQRQKLEGMCVKEPTKTSRKEGMQSYLRIVFVHY